MLATFEWQTFPLKQEKIDNPLRSYLNSLTYMQQFLRYQELVPKFEMTYHPHQLQYQTTTTLPPHSVPQEVLELEL